MKTKLSFLLSLMKSVLVSSVLSICASQTQAEPVAFSSATATFNQTFDRNWLPSEMIDGIVIPGLNGWAIKGADGSTNSQTALLTLTNPLPAGPHNWMVTMYQVYEGAPGAFQSGFFLGDFSLAYTTASTPLLSSAQTPFTVTGATSLNGTTFTSLGAGQIIISPFCAANSPFCIDVYSIRLTENSALAITGLFLNAINDPKNGFPTGGPGLYPDGNFVISELSANAVETQTPAVPLPAALPLFATGLGVLGLFGWGRKRKAALGG
jgi:hypothetical protein